MSSDDSPKAAGPSINESILRAAAEYEAARRKEIDEALALLQTPGIETAHRGAYEASLSEMLALPTTEIPWPCRDPSLAIHRALERAIELDTRRTEIEERFTGSLRLDWMFSLEQYALATLHAFKVWRAHPEPEGSFAELLSRAAELRSRFAADLAPLLTRNLLDKHRVRHFDGGTTPENVACDLFLLTGVLQDVYPKVAGRVAYTPLELMEGTVVARALLRTALRSDRSTVAWQPAEMYARAYALVDRAYFEGELAFAELHDADDAEEPRGPNCVFCENSRLTMQRHHRRHESHQTSARRAAFVTATLTAALRGNTMEN